MDLVSPYREYFSITMADTDELRKEVYKLRYEVYCRELGWEDPNSFPDGLEKDIYDDCSRHCLLKHKRTGVYAGTVRMVMTDRSPPNRPPVPMVEHCGDTLFDGPFRPDRLSVGSYGEISRLALHSEFRRRASEQLDPEGQGEQLFEWTQTERRRFPHIALGLYLGRFEQVGEPISFRGLRAPYYISRKALMRYLSRPLRRLLFAIADDMQLEV